MGQSWLASHMPSATRFHYPSPTRLRGCSASSDATRHRRELAARGGHSHRFTFTPGFDATPVASRLQRVNAPWTSPVTP